MSRTTSGGRPRIAAENYPERARPGARLGALQEREFRLFFTGQLVSLLGDAVTLFALAWAVLDLTGSARDVGFVIAAKTAPLVIFLLAGGVFADRLPRRGVMLTADVARMAVQAATAALLLSQTARIWELIVLQALAGTATAFFNPASTGLTPMTVSEGRLQEANALRGMSMASMQLAGPAVAGILIGRRRCSSTSRRRHCRGSVPMTGSAPCCASRSDSPSPEWRRLGGG
jgi:Na+/melibiose symporter-like transporter